MILHRNGLNVTLVEQTGVNSLRIFCAIFTVGQKIFRPIFYN